MQNNDLTVPQAQDLAHYFLGPDFAATCCEKVVGRTCYLHRHHSGGSSPTIATGSTWREVFRAASVKLPYRPRFIARDRAVLNSADPVATAVSATMARRISNALNEYEPGRNGR